MDDLYNHKQAGFAWHLRSDAPQGIVDRLLALRAGDDADVRIVKSNPLRTVYAFEMGGEFIFAKWHRFRGYRDALLALFRGTRAAREWKAISALKQSGIPTIEPLLVAKKTCLGLPRESFLVTRAVEGVSLKEIGRRLLRCNDKKSTRRRHAIVKNLGKVTRALHEGGIAHPDLHLENILATGSAGDLCLLDLHSATLHRRVPRYKRIQNLALLCRSVVAPGGTIRDRVRFIRAYLGAGASGEAIRDLAQAIETKVRRLAGRRLRSRSRRCVVKSSVYTNEKTPLGRVYRERTFATEQVSQAVRLHQRTMDSGPEGTIVKRSLKTNVTLIDWTDDQGPRRLCIKEFVRSGFVRLLPAGLRHLPAMRSWKAALGLAVRGVPAVGAHAVVMGKRASSYLVMPVAQDAEGLVEYIYRVFNPSLPPRKRRIFLRAAAGFLLKCYAAGVFHSDLKASNVLVRKTGEDASEFMLLDLAAVEFPGHVRLEQKLLNLAQLNASTPINLSWTDRCRFLRHLAKVDPRFGDRSALREIARITRERKCLWAQ